nr:immunoglobulin light chain junction region [Macaca mulatta]MPO04176.1 immunoglobulin light chain junction region [Macaca mulatta]MPO06557.1 immunoglobulin light chain junction region [Macaca mulatta]MPO11566.1 immunoglobulin light chain junction region [Macaca mulatta]
CCSYTTSSTFIV